MITWGKLKKFLLLGLERKYSLMYLRHFPVFILMLIHNISGKGILKRFNSQVNQDKMKEGHLLFKAYFLFHQKVIPSLWTL